MEAEEKIYKIPIIALTANVTYNRDEYIDAGMVDVLTKPFNEEKLKKMINSLKLYEWVFWKKIICRI